MDSSEPNASKETTMRLWNEFLKGVIEAGFELISFQRSRVEEYGEVRFPALLTAAHREKKLLLVATSHTFSREEHLNSVRIYGTIDRSDVSKGLSFATSVSNTYGDPRSEFTIERDDALGVLSYVEEQGTLVDWHDPNRWVWLLTYTQEKELDKDPDLRKRLWDEFLESAPDWVQSFIR